MKKTITMMMILFIVFALTIINATANGEHDFTEAKALVEGKVSCDQLTDEQLEEIGDYLMEQMHPGEAHELMDAKMGGEGSESLKLMHINMAKSLYCGESTALMGGMMGMMGTGGMGMMGPAFGMMGNYVAGSYNPWSPWWMSGWMLIFWLAFWAAIIWFVVWLVRQTAEKGRGEGRREVRREGESALAILRKRYAKGELTKKQYQQMRKALR